MSGHFLRCTQVWKWEHSKIPRTARCPQAIIIWHTFCTAEQDIHTRIQKWYWFHYWNYNWHNRNCNTGMKTTSLILSRDGNWTTENTVSQWMEWCNFYIMTSSNGHIFRVTLPLYGKPPVTGGFPSQMDSNADFWCFVVASQNKLLNKLDGPVIPDVMTVFWRRRNGRWKGYCGCCRWNIKHGIFGDAWRTECCKHFHLWKLWTFYQLSYGNYGSLASVYMIYR